MCTPKGKKVPLQEGVFTCENNSCTGWCISPKEGGFPPNTSYCVKIFFLLGKSNFCKEMHLPVGEYSFLGGRAGECTCLWENTSYSGGNITSFWGMIISWLNTTSWWGAGERVLFYAAILFPVGKHIFLWGTLFSFGDTHLPVGEAHFS